MTPQRQGNAADDGVLKSKWFDARCLDGRADQWAVELKWAFDWFNGSQDPNKGDAPVLWFSGEQAMNKGATCKQLAALAPLTPEGIAALRNHSAALRRDRQRQVDTIARSMDTARAAVTPPEPVELATLLAEPDEGVAYRITDLWPAGGRVLLAAPYKAGKSTTVGNVIRGLVDNDPFLGRFDTTPVGKVALIDTELDRNRLRHWLRDQGIRNTAAVSVVSLRGAVSTFDITAPTIRADWARRLAGADVVILDCLRPVIDALGLSEDKDAGKVLVAFDALLAEIGATEGMVVTHMGHQYGAASERARGDSRLLDWADSLWKIVRGGDDNDDDTARPSYFSALGRDVALPEGKLSFDPATRHLAYEGGSRRDAHSREAVPDLVALITAQPGLSKRQVERRLMDAHKLTQRAVRSAIAAAVNDGSVVVTTGARKAQLLAPAGVQIRPLDPFSVPSEGPK